MSTPSKDAVAIVETHAFRERVRSLLLRHGSDMLKLAYPLDGSTGTAEAIKAAGDAVHTIRRMTATAEELRDACYHLLSEYPTPLDPSQGGQDLADSAILEIIAYGMPLWAKAEDIP